MYCWFRFKNTWFQFVGVLGFWGFGILANLGGLNFINFRNWSRIWRFELSREFLLFLNEFNFQDQLIYFIDYIVIFISYSIFFYLVVEVYCLLEQWLRQMFLFVNDSEILIVCVPIFNYYGYPNLTWINLATFMCFFYWHPFILLHRLLLL